MRSPSEGSAAVDAILWLVCAPIELKKRNIFNRGLACPWRPKAGLLLEYRHQPSSLDRASRGCSFDGIDEDRMRIGSKIEGFGQRIQFSLRAECAMICSRDG